MPEGSLTHPGPPQLVPISLDVLQALTAEAVQNAVQQVVIHQQQTKSQIRLLTSMLEEQQRTIHRLSAGGAPDPNAAIPTHGAANGASPTFISSTQDLGRVDHRLISSLKLADIAPFAGAKDGSVTIFLQSADTRFEMLELLQSGLPLPDAIKVYYLDSRLIESARTWWEHQTRHKPLRSWSYPEMHDALKREFSMQ